MKARKNLIVEHMGYIPNAGFEPIPRGFKLDALSYPHTTRHPASSSKGSPLKGKVSGGVSGS